MDLTLTHLRQLADVTAGLSDVVSRHGLCRITGELIEAVKYLTQLRECVEGAMGSLREFEALLCSEQPLDEPVQLLSADERYMGQALPKGAKMKSSAESIHLDGVFLSVKNAMRRAGGGSIIMTSSVAGLRGSAGLAGYCATKGGVRLFAKAVAMECAAEADGMRVNTVHPGVIDTPIWTKLSGSGGRNVPIDPNEVAKAGVPLGRAGQAQTSQMACYSSPLTRLTT